MALPNQFDEIFPRGDDRSITATIVDQAGAPVDITGAAITYAVFPLDTGDAAPRSQPQNGATAIITKTDGAGIVITDAPNGGIRIDLGSGDTVAFVAPKAYYHEVQIVLGGLTTTMLFGTLTLSRDGIPPGP